MIRRNWQPASADRPAISDPEKAFIRDHILNAIVMAHSNVRAQLISSMACILSHDYPDNWPDFIEKCVALLGTRDFPHMYAGFVALQQLIQLYQWKSNEARTPLNQIIKATFPTIAGYVDALLAEPVENVDAGMMIKLAFKMYLAAIQVRRALSREFSRDLSSHFFLE